MVPVTYAQMYTGIPNPETSVSCIATLVGTEIWERFYPKPREVLPTNYVPVQLTNILNASLGRIQDQAVADAKKTEIARAHFEGLHRRDMQDKKDAIGGAADAGAYGYSAY